MSKEVSYGKKIIVTNATKNNEDGTYEPWSTAIGGFVHEIEKGKRTDMVFHATDKVVYVMSGKIRASVLQEGKMAAIEVSQGGSFYVKTLLIHQFEAIETSVLVEFTRNPLELDQDTHLVAKGSIDAPPVEPGEFVKMKPKEEEPAPTKKKTTRKKRTTKKKTSKKKTSRRKKKQ